MAGFKKRKDNGQPFPTDNKPKGSVDPHDAKSNGSNHGGIDHAGAKEIKEAKTMKQFLDSGRYLEDEVRSRADKKGSHFFDKDTMKFFSSKVSELMWSEGELKDYQHEPIYFITSEQDKGHVQHAGSVRAFTVRKIDADGDITTVGDFQGHPTLNDARKSIKEILGR